MEKMGVHWVVDMHGCNPRLLSRESYVLRALRDACEAGKLRVVSLSSHQFEPEGVTAIALLSTSHLSVHTWPEEACVAVDLFTCSPRNNPLAACHLLALRFEAGKKIVRSFDRGGSDRSFRVFPLHSIGEKERTCGMHT